MLFCNICNGKREEEQKMPMFEHVEESESCISTIADPCRLNEISSENLISPSTILKEPNTSPHSTRDSSMFKHPEKIISGDSTPVESAEAEESPKPEANDVDIQMAVSIGPIISPISTKDPSMFDQHEKTMPSDYTPVESAEAKDCPKPEANDVDFTTALYNEPIISPISTRDSSMFDQPEKSMPSDSTPVESAEVEDFPKPEANDEDFIMALSCVMSSITPVKANPTSPETQISLEIDSDPVLVTSHGNADQNSSISKDEDFLAGMPLHYMFL
mmetsp:Transcript_6601/g.10441  ORF Transcript_6601/g.10441 Transcript_6601/m.10441 type:complete len:274 (-) Transcript_6601:301-1122(-)